MSSSKVSARNFWSLNTRLEIPHLINRRTLVKKVEQRLVIPRRCQRLRRSHGHRHAGRARQRSQGDGMRQCQRPVAKTRFTPSVRKMERVMRFELTTSTLARLPSTPELHPRPRHTWPVWILRQATEHSSPCDATMLSCNISVSLTSGNKQNYAIW